MAIDAIEEPTLVVTHGGAMRAALAALCGFDHRQAWAFDLPYACLLSLRIWREDRTGQLGGQIIGLFVAGAQWAGGHVDPWTGALAALVGWVAITRALHLDGLSDLADGLGAAHDRCGHRANAASRSRHRWRVR